jgi:hypothetical protein
MTKHILPGFDSDENRIDFEEGLRGGVQNLVIPLTAFRRKNLAISFTGFSRKGRRPARARPGSGQGAENHPFRSETS